MRICPRCRAIYSAQVDRCPSDNERVADEGTFPLIGQTLDRYQIVEALGEGAMGGVYRATHNVLPREYALKVLFKDLASNQTLIERFRREAQAVSTMAHPNIVSVADFVTLDNGTTFIVMELVPGRTLEAAILSEAPFTPKRAAQITRQIAAGLGEAHRMGFVHRDVKPSNIMLTEAHGAELVKILDFGVVGIGAGPMSSRLTAVGHIIGTPTYMAPEQVHDPSVGPPADLYALGVILFEMLAGEPPFQGVDRTQVFVKHISEPPPRLPLCQGLELLAYWLLEKPAAKRPKNADAVIEAIDRLGILEHESGGTTDELETTFKPPVNQARPAITGDRREPRPIFEADTYRPNRRPLIEQREVFEPETDSLISKVDVERALADTDPSGDQKKNIELAEKLGTIEEYPDDLIPGPRTGTTDDLFPALTGAATGNNQEWNSWDPDGSFQSEHPVERNDTLQLGLNTREAPATDPTGTRPIVDPAEQGSPDRVPERVLATQLVRSRGRPNVGEAVVQLDVHQDASTDLMLYEPELPAVGGPPGNDKTERTRVDDGPTQVDFQVDVTNLEPLESPIVRVSDASEPVLVPDANTEVAPASERELTIERPIIAREVVDRDDSTHLSLMPQPPHPGDSGGGGLFDPDTLNISSSNGRLHAEQALGPAVRPSERMSDRFERLADRPSTSERGGERVSERIDGRASTRVDTRTDARVENPTEVNLIEPANLPHDTTEEVIDEIALARAVEELSPPAEADVEAVPVAPGLVAVDIPLLDKDFDRAIDVLRANANKDVSTVEDFEMAHGPTRLNQIAFVPAPSATTPLVSRSAAPARPRIDWVKALMVLGIGILLSVVFVGTILFLMRTL